MALPHVTIYTDGGCKPNPGPGGWGVLLIAESGPTKELSGAAPDTTNNRMELTAAIEALRALNRPCRVTLYTDSEYLRRGITEWMPGWIKRGWQRGKDKAVKNQDLWQALATEIERHEIDWKWVKGHAGNAHNERVDQLAAAACEQLGVPDSGFRADVEIALRVSAPSSANKGGWAIRLSSTDPATRPRVLTGCEAGTTANRLELLAALEALRQVPPNAAVRVYCPGDYLHRGMTAWVSGWQKRNWLTVAGEPVKHQALWQALVETAQGRPVEWLPETTQGRELAHGLDELAAQMAKS